MVKDSGVIDKSRVPASSDRQISLVFFIHFAVFFFQYSKYSKLKITDIFKQKLCKIQIMENIEIKIL